MTNVNRNILEKIKIIQLFLGAILMQWRMISHFVLIEPGDIWMGRITIQLTLSGFVTITSSLIPQLEFLAVLLENVEYCY